MHIQLVQNLKLLMNAGGNGNTVSDGKLRDTFSDGADDSGGGIADAARKMGYGVIRRIADRWVADEVGAFRTGGNGGDHVFHQYMTRSYLRHGLGLQNRDTRGGKGY